MVSEKKFLEVSTPIGHACISIQGHGTWLTYLSNKSPPPPAALCPFASSSSSSLSPALDHPVPLSQQRLTSALFCNKTKFCVGNDHFPCWPGCGIDNKRRLQGLHVTGNWNKYCAPTPSHTSLEDFVVTSLRECPHLEELIVPVPVGALARFKTKREVDAELQNLVNDEPFLLIKNADSVGWSEGPAGTGLMCLDDVLRVHRVEDSHQNNTLPVLMFGHLSFLVAGKRISGRSYARTESLPLHPPSVLIMSMRRRKGWASEGGGAGGTYRDIDLLLPSTLSWQKPITAFFNRGARAPRRNASPSQALQAPMKSSKIGLEAIEEFEHVCSKILHPFPIPERERERDPVGSDSDDLEEEAEWLDLDDSGEEAGWLHWLHAHASVTEEAFSCAVKCDICQELFCAVLQNPLYCGSGNSSCRTCAWCRKMDECTRFSHIQTCVCTCCGFSFPCMYAS